MNLIQIIMCLMLAIFLVYMRTHTTEESNKIVKVFVLIAKKYNQLSDTSKNKIVAFLATVALVGPITSLIKFINLIF